MSRPLTIEEKDSLLKLIKKEGEFIYQGKPVVKSLIKIGALLESTTLDCKEKVVSFNGSCEFPPDLNYLQSTGPGIYEGTANMVGLNEFELNNPITIKKYS